MSLVKASYRNLFRATRTAFVGDVPTLTAARQKIREEYRAGAAQSVSKEELDEKVQYANEIALILRRNIVQGAKDQDSETDRYVLNIHKDTELGDNDSIKKNRQNSSGKRNTITGELVDESVPGVGN